MRRVPEREAHIRETHRLESLEAPALLFPGADELLPEKAESFARHLLEEGALVREVTIERRSRDSERVSDAPQGEALDTLCLNGTKRLLPKGLSEVAVVVPIRALPARGRAFQTGHGADVS